MWPSKFAHEGKRCETILVLYGPISQAHAIVRPPELYGRQQYEAINCYMCK